MKTEMTEQFENVVCLKCSRISFGVSRKFAENESKRFLEHYDSLDKKKAEDFWGARKTLEQMVANYTCLGCGGSSFRLATKTELKRVFGCTINPVIWEDRK
jgi:hypothetical protein